MTENLKLIRRRLDHLTRMRGYVAYSLSQVEAIPATRRLGGIEPGPTRIAGSLPDAIQRVSGAPWQDHAVRGHRGRAGRKRFGAVLAFMERLRVIDSVEQWKLIRKLRNAVNHEYENDAARLAEFFALMTTETPTLSTTSNG